MVINLNADSDADSVAALMENVMFVNTSDAPATNLRAVRFVLDDGDGGISETASVTVRVDAVNDTPSVSSIGDVATPMDTSTGAIAFTIDDDETLPGSLIVTATSDNQTIIPDGNIVLGGAGGSRTIEVTPATGETGGPVTITVTVDDGEYTTIEEFDVTVTNPNTPPTVALSNPVSPLAENTDTTGSVRVADIDITDDGNGTNDLSLSGTDAADFIIVGGQLHVKSGTVLNYEAKTSYDVRVNVDDTTLGGGIDDFVDFTLNLSDVDEFDVGLVTDTDATVDAVNENAAIGTAVGVTAFAEDLDGTDNVTYSLSFNPGSLFAINSTTGTITTNAVLDYEAATSHNITVLATSTDTSTNTLGLTITVNDLNDVTPVVDPLQSFNVNEDAANTTSVGFVTATDPDTVGGLTNWAITAGNTDSIFGINTATGELTVVDNTNLDYESTTSYTLSIQVEDGTNTSAIETVTVDINDVVEGVIVVDTTSNVVDGNTFSIATLTASKGADGRISLREAIIAANNTTNLGAPDQILFNIPDSDLGHLYYQEDFAAGLPVTPTVTSLNDAAITDFDSDYPYAQHSWFRIDVSGGPSQLTIMDAVMIDGYSQSGATANSLSIGQNAALRIELTNTGSDGFRGLTFDTGADGSTVRGLAINGFDWSGVMVESSVDNVSVQGNFIGTDVTGTVDIGNGDSGVQLRGNSGLVGGTAVANRNVISGGNSRGVTLFTGGTITGNVIQNNYIGADATGLNRLGNAGSAAIQLYGGDGTQVLDNVIVDNAARGIRFHSSSTNVNTVIQGNFIGVGADGSTQLGNAGPGIEIAGTTSNNLIGGSAAGQENVISDNTGHGILITGSGAVDNTIIGNFIGTDATGLLNRGNTGNGILVETGADDQTIGGILTDEGNVIAFNAGAGVGITGNGTDLVRIRGNAIHANIGMGIDLQNDGSVEPNDAGDGDPGPNNRQNFPVLTAATISGFDLTVDGSLNSNPSTSFGFDFFASTTADASGHGEAERYLGSELGISTNGSGNLAFSKLLSGANVTAGEFITATATDQNGNTSEFALNIVAINNLAPVAVHNGPYVINEGDGVLLTAVGSTDPEGDSMTYDWDIDDNGTYDIIGNISPALTWLQLQGYGIDEGDVGGLDYDIKLRVNDDQGNSTIVTTQVTVNDVPPDITVTGTGSVAEGSLYTINLSATDDGTDVITNWFIDWGDGTQTSTALFTASHSYATGGFHNIVVMAQDGDGTWYDGDLLVPGFLFNGEIYRVDPNTGGITQTITGGGSFQGPVEAVSGPGGEILVSIANTGKIVVFDAAGTELRSYSSGVSNPVGLDFSPVGELVIGSFSGEELTFLDPATGTITHTEAMPVRVTGFAYGPDGSIYVAGFDPVATDWRIVRFDGVNTTPIVTGLSNLEDLDVGPDGNIYVAEKAANQVGVYDLTGGFVRSIAVTTPYGLEFTPNGELLVSSGDGLNPEQVERFNPITGAPLGDLVPDGPTLDEPHYLNFVGSHEVVVANEVDLPSVTGTTTPQDIQTTSGLVVTRHATDGSEIRYVKITNITNGTLYQNDGTTAIANGSFITYAEASAGLKFTPNLGFTGAGSFDAQVSTHNDNSNLSTAVTANITVGNVNDAPVLTSTGGQTITPTTDENTTSSAFAVSAIVGATIADVDPAPVEGIAITAVSGNGRWEFSLDGVLWNEVSPTVDLVSPTNTLLLRETDFLRYVPDNDNGETATIDYRAWDQTGATFGLQGTRTNPGCRRWIERVQHGCSG